jgi:hypothetical protein
MASSGGDSIEAALVMDAAWRRACEALEQERVWRDVQHVASKLLAVCSLTADDLRRLL